MPRSRKRTRHRLTVGRLVRQRLAISVPPKPSAAISTICARCTKPCGKLFERAIDSNCSRSSSVKVICVFGRAIAECSAAQEYTLDRARYVKLHTERHTRKG